MRAEPWVKATFGRFAQVRNGADYTANEVETGGYPVYGSGGAFRRVSTYLYDGESVLFGRKGTVDRPLYVTGKFWTVDTMFYSIIDRERLNPRFAYYWATTLPFGAWATDTALPSMTSTAIKAAPIILPSVEKQRAIADYLDRETERIDAFIAKNEELIALLTERRETQSMRLLLESPSTTQRVPLKAVIRKLRRPVSGQEKVVTAFRDGQVTSRAKRRTDGFTETETESRSGYQGVRVGDLVYHGLDGFAGATGVSESDGICSPVYHVCRVSHGADAEFIALLLRALGKSGYLEAEAWSVRQRSVDYRNWSTFSRLQVEIPQLAVQREARSSIAAAAYKTKNAIYVAQCSIDLARERRAALISAAVTGNIDVREVS